MWQIKQQVSQHKSSLPKCLCLKLQSTRHCVSCLSKLSCVIEISLAVIREKSAESSVFSTTCALKVISFHFVASFTLWVMLFFLIGKRNSVKAESTGLNVNTKTSKWGWTFCQKVCASIHSDCCFLKLQKLKYTVLHGQYLMSFSS